MVNGWFIRSNNIPFGQIGHTWMENLELKRNEGCGNISRKQTWHFLLLFIGPTEFIHTFGWALKTSTNNIHDRLLMKTQPEPHATCTSAIQSEVTRMLRAPWCPQFDKNIIYGSMRRFHDLSRPAAARTYQKPPWRHA